MANGRLKTASFGPGFLGAILLFCAFAVMACLLFRFIDERTVDPLDLRGAEFGLRSRRLRGYKGLGHYFFTSGLGVADAAGAAGAGLAAAEVGFVDEVDVVDGAAAANCRP